MDNVSFSLMLNRTIGITIVAIFGVIVGLWNLFIGFSDKSNTLFIVIGMICIFLSFGFFKLWYWARITILIFSSIIICIYTLLVIGTIKDYFQGFGGLGLLANFPILLLSIIFLNILNRPEIKNKFKK